jgi:hypothetical protein
MHKLLNSAMMPVEGFYQLQRVTSEKFAEWLRAEPFESYIGYPDTARLIEQIAGVKVPLSREQTTLADGDVLLICRLKYRVQIAADKGNFTPKREDFEFFVCHYRD